MWYHELIMTSIKHLPYYFIVLKHILFLLLIAMFCSKFWIMFDLLIPSDFRCDILDFDFYELFVLTL